jgi:DNA-binding beta-propeller fold protein YncE
MHRTAALTLALVALGTAPAVGQDAAPKEAARPKSVRVLPGVQADGLIRLPNQWALRPAGKQIEVGDFPVALALHPAGKYLAVLHAGYGPHEIFVLDIAGPRQRVISRVVLAQTFGGLAFAPDGNTLYAGGGEFGVVHAFSFADGYLARHRELSVAGPKEKFIAAGLAVDPAGKWLYTAGTWSHSVCLLPLDRPDEFVSLALGKDSYPYGCLVDAPRKRLYVSLWNKAQVAVINLEDKQVAATWPTERHPTEMALSPDGKTFYVACANSTRVSVLGAADGKGLETINCALYPNAPNGNTPSSLALTPDGQLLFVANADANNLAVFNVSVPGKARPLGFIPTGMYPTSVRFNPADKKLYVTSGRGTSPKANVHGPNPLLREDKTVHEYIAGLYRGTLGILDVPTEARMIAYSKQAYLCSPLRPDLHVVGRRPKGSPIPGKVGESSPIKYSVYIIRENRTYDQVLGDVKGGNGDPALCLFPEKITPNAHRLARQYVLLDNFYCEGEVSAEGHEWSMGAYCTDFVRRVWPLAYRGSPTKKLHIYPAEGEFDEIARPAGGYLWDRCAPAGVSYRSYGEWVKNGEKPGDPATPLVKALEEHFDPGFRSFDMDYPEAKRADRFLEELRRFEREGDLARLIILRLPNDHTAGTKVGTLTPTAFVAENDLALGRVIEALSKSKFWKEMAVFVVEDDAQNGADHVDAHRTVALVVSPYTRGTGVDSTLYSTSSMLRTMELILGLEPMSQFDAAAHPMYGSFRARPDTTPYEHVVPDTDMKAKNTATAWGAKLSEKMDFTVEDAADDLLLNEVIWRSVRGPHAPMPPPVRAAFVFPHLPKEQPGR